MEFGVPPFTMATKDNAIYRIFFRGSNSFKYFFKLHPATKDLYNNDQIDNDLVTLIMALLDPNPEARPSINQIRQSAYLHKERLDEK
jgi:hypothetical protein